MAKSRKSEDRKAKYRRGKISKSKISKKKISNCVMSKKKYRKTKRRKDKTSKVKTSKSKRSKEQNVENFLICSKEKIWSIYKAYSFSYIMVEELNYMKMAEKKNVDGKNAEKKMPKKKCRWKKCRRKNVEKKKSKQFWPKKKMSIIWNVENFKMSSRDNVDFPPFFSYLLRLYWLANSFLQ